MGKLLTSDPGGRDGLENRKMGKMNIPSGGGAGEGTTYSTSDVGVEQADTLIGFLL